MRLDPLIKGRFQEGLSKGWNPEKRREFWVARLPRDVVMASEPKGKVVLDAGTGRGRFAIAFAKAGAKRVVAMDISPMLIKSAREEAVKAGVRIEFGIGDVENMKYADGSFDIACSMGTTIHLPNPSKAVSELKRVCKPGGLVVTNTVISNPPKQGSHWKTFTEEEFLKLFEENGLEISRERIYFQEGIELYGMMAVARVPCG